MSPIRGGRKYAISRSSAYMMTGVMVLHICACLYRPELVPHALAIITYFAAMTGTNLGHNAANATEAVKLNTTTTTVEATKTEPSAG